MQFLRAALGPCAVPAPAISLSTATFSAIANAALNSTGLVFAPYFDDIAFLMSVFVYEDVGVTACAWLRAALHFSKHHSHAIVRPPDNYAAGLLSSYTLINAGACERTRHLLPTF